MINRIKKIERHFKLNTQKSCLGLTPEEMDRFEILKAKWREVPSTSIEYYSTDEFKEYRHLFHKLIEGQRKSGHKASYVGIADALKKARLEHIERQKRLIDGN